jgi:hypothetical protein
MGSTTAAQTAVGIEADQEEEKIQNSLAARTLRIT